MSAGDATGPSVYAIATMDTKGDEILFVADRNSEVTLMRTTAEESREIASWIATKVNRSTEPILILIPEGGLSMLDAPGQAFFDPIANAVLFDELERRVRQDPRRQVKRLPYHITDPAFSHAVVEAYVSLASTENSHR